MAWAKIDDGWWCHPKVMALSLPASGLWARALSWSCQQRRDTVPERFVMMVGGEQEHADELVHAGLWVETDNGYRIHDWSEYQERTLSEKRADAGRKGGKKSGEARSKAEDETPPDQQEHEANGKQTEANERSNGEAKDEAGALPVPSPPSPTQEQDQEIASRKRSDRATRLPADWHPDPEPELVEVIGGQDVAKGEFAKFRDYWTAKAGKDGRKVDWQATWRNWLRNSAERKGGGAAAKAPRQDPVAAQRGAGWR